MLGSNSTRVSAVEKTESSVVTEYTSDVCQITLSKTDCVRAVYGLKCTEGFNRFKPSGFVFFSPHSLCLSRSVQFNAMSDAVIPGCTAQV